MALLVGGLGMDDIAAMPGNLVHTLRQRLIAQWTSFKAFCRPRPRAPGTAADDREYAQRDRFECDALKFGAPKGDAEGKWTPKLPAWYWIRTRVFWPVLSELMLYCAAVCSGQHCWT